jgi:hypothetical protein
MAGWRWCHGWRQAGAQITELSMGPSWRVSPIPGRHLWRNRNACYSTSADGLCTCTSRLNLRPTSSLRRLVYNNVRKSSTMNNMYTAQTGQQQCKLWYWSLRALNSSEPVCTSKREFWMELISAEINYSKVIILLRNIKTAGSKVAAQPSPAVRNAASACSLLRCSSNTSKISFRRAAAVRASKIACMPFRLSIACLDAPLGRKSM